MIEFPTPLAIVLTRELAAPIELVFDVLTKPEHIRETIAPFGETVTVCTADLRPGGAYHYVFVAADGKECSFRGTYLEIEPPARTVQTWRFEGWPEVEAIESNELCEANGITKVAWKLRFRDEAGRDHMTKFDGLEANFDNVERYLKKLLREGSRE
jgi:uncharacterized protein YndB with AHSA1/START domain